MCIGFARFERFLIIPQFLRSSRRQSAGLLIFAVIMLIWNRIVRRRGEIGFARFGGSRASASSSFSGSVGFSNFVLRIRGLRSRACSANAGFSGLPGFSVRYYVALMDVKSEATPRRRVKRRTDENPSLFRFISHVTLEARMRGFVLSFSFFRSLICADKGISVRKKSWIIWKRHMVEWIYFILFISI